MLASGDVDAALEKLKLAAEHDTPDYQANKTLVNVLLQLKRYDDALAVTKALQAKLPGKALPFNLEGTVYVAQQDLVRARKAFLDAIAAEPGNDASVLNLVQIDLAEDKLEDARSRLDSLAGVYIASQVREDEFAPAVRLVDHRLVAG